MAASAFEQEGGLAAVAAFLAVGFIALCFRLRERQQPVYAHVEEINRLKRNIECWQGRAMEAQKQIEQLEDEIKRYG